MFRKPITRPLRDIKIELPSYKHQADLSQKPAARPSEKPAARPSQKPAARPSKPSQAPGKPKPTAKPLNFP